MSIKDAEIELGLKAEQFIESDIGKLLIGKSEQDFEKARDELLGIDPWKFSTLADLQNAILAIQQEARTAQRIKDYLTETIITGQQADQPEE